MKDTEMTSQNAHNLHPDLDLESYDFHLPQEMIAQNPPSKRQSSRLLVLDRSSGTIADERFSRLADVLPPKSVVVTNVSKVIPARVQGRKRSTQGKIEFLLLTPLPAVETSKNTQGVQEALVEGLLRPAKGLKPGSEIDLNGDIRLVVQEVLSFGRCRVRLLWRGNLGKLLSCCGSLPLPPYIRRMPGVEDMRRYQTVYARDGYLGSVAAPTAGLHFTSEQIAELTARGHGIAELVLYVGYGTFTPIRVRDVRQHTMHAELMELTENAAEKIRRAKDEGRAVVAVGTTAVRALESVYALFGQMQAYWGWTDLFLYPGSKFHVVDHMITNFHLPRSSLILMVAAFAGREKVLAAYEHAVAQGYRFFSYGDAMFIR